MAGMKDMSLRAKIMAISGLGKSKGYRMVLQRGSKASGDVPFNDIYEILKYID